MTRYLTPSKVALLALITVYTEGVVPNSAIVPVLSFLVSHLLPLDPSKSADQVNNPGDHTIPIEDFERVTSCLPSSVPGRSIWDIFLKRLWLIDCFDTLEEFITGLTDILVKSREELIRDRNHGIPPDTRPNRLGRASPLGTFVRRAQLEYTKLRFDDAVELWTAFVGYRMSTYRAWAKRHSRASQSMVDVNLADLGADLASPLAKVVYGEAESGNHIRTGMSMKDIERLLEFQVGELQCRFASAYWLDFQKLTIRRSWWKGVG